MGNLNVIRIFLLEYYRTHKIKSLFSFFGISLGVALFITTNLNGRRAERSLIDFSTGYLSRNFSLRIFHTDSANGVSEDIINKIYYNESFRWISSIQPRIQKTFFIKNDSTTNRIIYQAVDLFMERKNYQFDSNKEDLEQEIPFLEISYFSNSALDLYNKANKSITFKDTSLEFPHKRKIDSDGGNFIIEDISKAKERFGENINYTYLLIEGETDANKIQELRDYLNSLDKGLSIETPEEIRDRAGSALKSYNLNLVIISMISVLIAFFMVSNTMSGIYLSRRKEFGILRSLGTTPLQNLILFQMQALVLGLVGSCAGILMGIYFAGYRFFSGELTISDTSQAGTYTFVPNALIIVGFIIGMGGSVLSALIPSIRSYQISPISILKDLPKKGDIPNPKFLFFGGVGLVLLAYPISQIKFIYPFPLFGLFAIGMIVIGETLQFPYLFGISTIVIQKFLLLFDKAFLELRIGIEEIYQNPIKNSLTGAALMLAVSLVISLTQLTESYKKSIIDWTEEEFPYQYSVVNLRDIQEGTADGMPLSLKEKIKSIPEVSLVDVFILNNKVEAEGKIYLIHGYDMELAREREIASKKESIYPQNFGEGVFISSNMAYLGGKKAGETISLPTKTGNKDFSILGIKEHFFSESGTIMMDEKLYENEFRLENYRALRVNFKSGLEAEGLKNLNTVIMNEKDLSIMSADDLKKVYLEGTERVFGVLESLKVTACLIALISLFSSILHSLGDKMKLFAMLKSLGGSSWQISIIVFAENLFLSLFGSLAGILSALLLGPIILDVINKNAFGWTLKVVYPINMMLVFILFTPIIAFLGTLYPYRILSKLSLRDVLNYE